MMILRSPQASALGLALFFGGLAATPAALAQDEVMATVNGTEITRADLEAAYGELPAQYRQMPLEAIEGPLLDQLIDQQLLLGVARDQGLQDEDQVQADIARAGEDVLRRALIERTVAEATTDEALQEAYTEVEPVEEVHARHILLETEEAALDVIKELDEGGDFVVLAEERSTGPSAPNGGDLGFFKREAMVPEFADAAFSMEPGAYSSEPVQSQFGFHVIKVEDKRTVEADFATVEPQLREELAREAVANLLEDVRAEADIERTNDTAE